MELEIFVVKVKLQLEMCCSEFCSRCDLTLLIIVVIFDRLFVVSKVYVCRCFSSLKIIFCLDAFLLFDDCS
jgi:hypothetical protein